MGGISRFVNLLIIYQLKHHIIFIICFDIKEISYHRNIHLKTSENFRIELCMHESPLQKVNCDTYSHFLIIINLIYYLEFFLLSCIDRMREILAEICQSALGINVRYFLQPNEKDPLAKMEL